MYTTNEFRKGLKVVIDGYPWIIVDNQFVKPGKGQSFSRVRFKNLMTGATLDRTFKSGDQVEKADVSEEKMQFLYENTGEFVFMNTVSYEQYSISAEVLSDAKNFLIENLECTVIVWNDRPIAVDPPNFVEMQIVECDPGIRGDTVSGATKPAKVSSGFTVYVPLFVDNGEWIRIDTRDGSYLDRVKR